MSPHSSIQLPISIPQIQISANSIMKSTNRAPKQTLKAVMEDENHLDLSDTDSDETDKAITYHSPPSDSDSSKSDTHIDLVDSDDDTIAKTSSARTSVRAKTAAESPATSSVRAKTDFTETFLPAAESPARQSARAKTDSVMTFPPETESPARSSVRAKTDYSLAAESPAKSSIRAKIAAASPARSSVIAKTAAETLARAKTDSSPAAESPAKSSVISKADSSPEEESPARPSVGEKTESSPARSSISSDQISLPHESFQEDINRSDAPKPNPEPVVKRSVEEETLAVTKVRERRRLRPVAAAAAPLSILKRVEIVKKAALGFRVFGFLFSLVSFSVMAADRHQGWALDSFQRYKEFRYCMSVNVIGFVYSGAQAFDLAFQSATGKNILQHHLRDYIDFAFDQVVTYLLISASSSAATRVDDWQLNWGKDKFPDMASASVAMSFLAFAALAFSSLISGYVLCNS